MLSTKKPAKDHPVNHATRHGPVVLRLIGAYKVVKSLLLLAVGFEIYHLLNGDVGENLERWVFELRLDPDNRYIHAAIAQLAGVDRHYLKEISFGTFFYAVLDAVEGVGLWLRRHWAEYLTIVATASLLPFEGYEIVRKASAAKIAVLLFNLAIVVYLIYRVRQDRILADARDRRTDPFGPTKSSL